MAKISVIIILLLQTGRTFAQNYFVFIGADNRQPFYVRVDSQFHSSSAEGHLILSQLKDSTYNITLGFPGQTQPEQHYSLSIDGKDQAFELRSQDPDGLRLYNLQNNQWLSPQGGGVAAVGARSSGVKKDDAFSRMMAGVVHDTAVLYNTYALEQALSDSPATATATVTATTTHSATAKSAAAQPIAAQSASADTANASTAMTTPTATLTSPDSTTSKPADTTITTIGNPAASPTHTTPTNTGATAPSTPAPSTTAATTTTATSTTAITTTAAATASSTTSATASPTAPTDTAATHSTGAIIHEPAARFNDSGTTAPSSRPTPAVTKLSERHTTKNVRLMYALLSGSKKADTIDVVIPVDSPATAKTAGHSPHSADSNRVPAARGHAPGPDSPIASSGTAYRPTVPPTAPTEATRPHPADSSHKPGKTLAFVNSDCHDFASDFDVDRLRVRMLEFSKDEERIAAARKEFKVRCYYTRQIRALSDVFTSDAAKFHFFEAAWPFAADEHFHELSDLLTDPVYNSKFKTMTHQQ